MNIYVSLTSIYQKQYLLLNTLISINKQTLLPNKCYIYLSTEPYLLDKGFTNKKLNKDLEDYVCQNPIFEIRWCDNLGPYRKLLPLLREKWNENCLILTMDDDIYYHKDLIKQVVDEYNKEKCCVTCRGFTLEHDNNNINSLDYVSSNKTIRKHLYNFANSGVGTVHHPSFYHKTGDLIFNLEYINELCKTSDDIWYALCRIANNIETVICLEYEHYIKFNMSNFTNVALCINYNYKNNTNQNNFQSVVKRFIELGLIK